MPKRRRRAVFNSKKVRPKDKQILGIQYAGANQITTAQRSTSLYTWTFPGTITGLRWSINLYDSIGTGSIIWAIMVVRDGVAPDLLAIGVGVASLATPEQNVLAWGSGAIIARGDGSNSVYHAEGTSKGMRKLMGGDQLYFLVSPTADMTGSKLEVIVQFFNLS